MKAFRLALCAAVLGVAISAPAEAASWRYKSYKAQKLYKQHSYRLAVPLILGVGY